MTDKDKDTPDTTSVFFSYSRVDVDKALPIIAAIERAGFPVWWDGMLEGGTSYLETTEEALESAKAVVVLWSKTSVASHWVRDEAMSGRVRGRMIPLSLDGTPAPLGFRQVQHIDYTQWQGRDDEACAEELSRVLGIMHAEENPIIATAAIPLPAASKHPAITRRTMLLAGGGAGLLALGGLALFGNLPFRKKSLLNNGIAVLPFRNQTGDAGNDFIAAGLSSELRSRLARNAALMVVARSSIEAIAEQGLSPQEIAQRFGVTHVFDGYIRLVGNDIKVIAELIDGETGFSGWTKEFQHASSDILALQNEISDAVTQSLLQRVSEEANSTQDGETENPQAYNEYLRGTDLFRSSPGRASAQKALEHFEQAIRLDPSFTKAHASRARLLLWFGGISADSALARDYFDAAITAARTAVSLGPNHADAHSTLGYVLFSAQLNKAEARVPFEKSRELGVGSSPILARYAIFMAVTGRDTDATSAINRALDLDPLNATIHDTAAFIHYAARRFDDAISTTRRVLDMNSRQFNARARIGLSKIYSGQIDAGIEICEGETNQMERLPCLAIGYSKRGEADTAEGFMTTLIETFGDAGAYQQAQVMAQWGRLDEGMDILRKAEALSDSGLTLALIDPALDPLRGRGDFTQLLARLGLSV